jgi:Skp family chaperone for outer membrane proteins
MPMLRAFPALLLAAIFLMASAQTTPPQAPTRIAVINTAHMLAGLDEMTDAQRAIDAMRVTAQKEIDRRKAEIDHLSADLDNPNLYKKDSAEFRKLQDDLLQKSLDLQSFTQFSQQKLFMELRLRTLLVTRKMDDSLAAYSQYHGYAVVLTTQDIALDKARTQQELESTLMARRVAYLHPTADITSALLQEMNTDYRLGTKSGK